MTKEIANILKGRLIGLPFIGTIAGIVQPVIDKKFAEDTNVMSAKKMPVSYDVCESDADVNDAKLSIVGMERQLVPNAAVKSILYFEDNGSVLDSKGPAGKLSFIASIRLVCWLNKKKLVPGRYTELTAYAIGLITRKLMPGRAINSNGITRMFVTAVKAAPQSEAIFAPYNYDTAETQYLRPPYEYFALDLTISYTLRSNCLPQVEFLPDISICAKPADVHIFTPIEGGCTYAWGAIDGATGYQIQIQKKSTRPDAGAWVNIETNQYFVDFTLLNAKTIYTLYVRTNCGSSDSGSASINFTTP